MVAPPKSLAYIILPECCLSWSLVLWGCTQRQNQEYENGAKGKPGLSTQRSNQLIEQQGFETIIWRDGSPALFVPISCLCHGNVAFNTNALHIISNLIFVSFSSCYFPFVSSVFIINILLCLYTSQDSLPWKSKIFFRSSKACSVTKIIIILPSTFCVSRIILNCFAGFSTFPRYIYFRFCTPLSHFFFKMNSWLICNFLLKNSKV